MVSKLSGTTKNLTTGIMQDPQKIENIISMVRTVAPLTSAQTVTKVNTYLPLFEKVSTLLGMYSFLNRAQTFRPIEPLNAKSPTDMMSALMKNGSMPMGKMLAQPLIANNMEKMMGAMAMNMMKNGGLNDLLKNGNIGDLLNNGNINDMLSSFTGNSGKNTSDNSNIDLSSLMETFMPLMNSMNTNNLSTDANNDNNNDHEENFTNYYDNTPKKIDLKNENYLQDTEDNYPEHHGEFEDKYTYDDSYDRYDLPKNERYDKNHKNNRYDNYEKAENNNEHKNNYNDKKEIQRPIRIKQRKRR